MYCNRQCRKIVSSIFNTIYILTIIDHFNICLEAYPLNNITSKFIIHCLNKYFSSFGIPKLFLTDNDTNLVCDEMVQFFYFLNIQHIKLLLIIPFRMVYLRDPTLRLNIVWQLCVTAHFDGLKSCNFINFFTTLLFIQCLSLLHQKHVLKENIKILKST